MPEHPWEPYESTKERVTEAISASMGSKVDESFKAEARKADITSCSRVGTCRLESSIHYPLHFRKGMIKRS